ncbi:MAG: hypothetical protein ABSG53_11165 [Thermoguttaceae bacterium]|jgi:hypothetical protein
MTLTLENIVVLLFVAAAAVYMVVRLRRVAAGQNKCVCGSKACGSASPPCGSSFKGAAASGEPSGGLPLIPPACNQGGCGCGKS